MTDSAPIPSPGKHAPQHAPATGEGDRIVVTPAAGIDGLRAPARSQGLQPLQPEQWIACVQITRRLHAEFSQLLSALPPEVRQASALSRHINVLRVTCQRLTKALRQSGDSPSMLSELPGPEGLDQIIVGCRSAGVAGESLDGAQASVEAFRQLIRRLAGSRTRLIERIALGEPGSGHESPELGGTPARRALIAAAAEITGRRCRVVLASYIFRPDPTNPALLERLMVKGVIGARLSPGGMPMVFNQGNTHFTDDEAHRLTLLNRLPVGGRTPEAFLRPFTTEPLPTITSRESGGTLRQVIDAASSSGRAFDVVTAVRATSPMFERSGTPALESVWSLVNWPAEHLILDVYLHRSIERHYRPSLDAHLWNTDLTIPSTDRWLSRLPTQPKLQILGWGTAGSASTVYTPAADLARSSFNYAGWNSDEFLGFRCEVALPVWRAGYSMSFEYLGPGPTGSSPASENAE